MKLVIAIAVLILVATNLAFAHSVSLTCSDATPGVTFNFYRGTTPGGESSTPINSSPVATCAYTDTTVVGLQTY